MDARAETRRENLVRVAAVQMVSRSGDKTANLEKIESFVEQAAAQHVQIIVFHEGSISGYWFVRNLTAAGLKELAEPVFEGSSSQKILQLSKRHNISIGAGLIEFVAPDAFYNSYIVALPNGERYCHRKLQAFEHPLIRAGSEYTVFDSPFGLRIGVLICYDNNILENVRINALMGADLILAPHNAGGCRAKNPHMMGMIDPVLWERRHEDPAAIEQEFLGQKGRGWFMRWLPSRAHDNGLFYIFANAVGPDDDEIRTGNAMILDPYGRILKELRLADDGMVICDLDKTLLEHATGREWIMARRPDLYGILSRPTGRERDTHELKFEE